MEKKLYKSRTDRKVSGVCGGIAKYIGVDVTIIRALWALSIIMFGTGAMVYLIFALVMPDEPLHEDGTDKINMDK